MPPFAEQTRKIESPRTKIELPIDAFETQIKETLRSSKSMVLIGETGSGKSTKGPQFIMDVLKEMDSDAKIAVTQPRKIAAVSVAQFVDSQSQYDVSHHVRFDRSSSHFTDINFMTDGWLLNYLKNNPLLEEFNAVLIDEAHERSLNIDLLMGLLKDVQQKRDEAEMSELKLIIASATIEEEKFKDYFTAESVSVPGKMYPVTKNFEHNDTNNYNFLQKTADKILDVLQNTQCGDILVFLPGKKEIEAVHKMIASMTREMQGIEIMDLHGQISPQDQSKIFKNSLGARKVILSTNMAETSVTFSGVTDVVDSGFINQTGYNATTGIRSLGITDHSKAGLRQRAGRAGRVGPGNYHFVGTEQQFANRPDYTEPEIRRTNLDSVVMTMLARDIPDIEHFDFLDKPPIEAVQKSIHTLRELGAVDEKNKLTEQGKTMSTIPLEPHLSKMVLESISHGVADEVVSAISFMSLKPVFLFSNDQNKNYELQRVQQKFKDSSSDFIGFLKVWQAFSDQIEFNKSMSEIRQWAHENGLNFKVLQEAAEIRWQILSTIKNLVSVSKLDEDLETSQVHDRVGKSIAMGLAGQLRSRGYRGVYDGVSKDIPSAKIFPGSPVMQHSPEYLVSGDVMQTSALYTHKNQSVKEEWLPELAPDVFEWREGKTTFGSEAKGMVIERSVVKKRYGETLVQSERPANSEEIKKYVFEKLCSGAFSINDNISDELKEVVIKNLQLINELQDIAVRSAGAIESANSHLLFKYYFDTVSSIVFDIKYNPLENSQLITLLTNTPFKNTIRDLIERTDRLDKTSPKIIRSSGLEIPVEYKKIGDDYIATIDLKDNNYKNDVGATLITTPGIIIKYRAKLDSRIVIYDSFDEYRNTWENDRINRFSKKYATQLAAFDILNGDKNDFNDDIEPIIDKDVSDYTIYPYFEQSGQKYFERRFTIDEREAIVQNKLAKDLIEQMKRERQKNILAEPEKLEKFSGRATPLTQDQMRLHEDWIGDVPQEAFSEENLNTQLSDLRSRSGSERIVTASRYSSIGYDEPRQSANTSSKQDKKKSSEIILKTRGHYLQILESLGVPPDMIELIDNDIEVIKPLVAWLQNPENLRLYKLLVLGKYPIASKEQENVRYFVEGVTTRLDPQELLTALQQMHNAQTQTTTRFPDSLEGAQLVIDLRDDLIK